MRFPLAFLTFCLPLSGALAQLNPAPIAVRIALVDAKNQAVVGASVQCRLHTDSTQAANRPGESALSDTTGRATLNLQANALYDLRVTAVGLKILTKGIRPTTAQSTFRFGLMTETTTLAAVTVTARKPLMRQQDDMTIVDPEPLANTSTNAYELLEKTPGLFIDQDGNVYLGSTSPATIYINGREQRMSASDVATLLKSLPPNSIERLELMRTPSAKYDASGGGGAVNVVLKKGVKLGRTGSVTANLNQGRFGNQGVGVNLSDGNGNRTTYLNLNYSRRNSYDLLTTTRQLFGNQGITQEAYTRNPGDALFGGYGIGHQRGTRWDLNLDGRATYGYANSFADNSTQIRAATNANLLTDNSNTVQNLGHSLNLTQGASARYKLDSLGSEITADLSYNYLSSSGSQEYQTQYRLPLRPTLTGDGSSTTARHFTTAKLDYVQKLPGKLTLEAGLKTAIQQFDSRTAYFTGTAPDRRPDSFRTNTFDYAEAIHSGYAQAAKTVGTVTLKAGLRLENTNMTGHQRVPTDTTFGVHRTDLFPYVYLSRPVMSIAGFGIRASLIYRRSITRPGYEQLNPFVRYIDPYLYETGNPALQPQFTQNVEANLTAGDIPIFAIGQNNTQQIFSSVLYQNPANPSVAYRTTDNLGRNRETYFRIMAGIPPGGRYFFVVSAQYNRNQYAGQYEGQPLAFSRGSWTLFTFQQLRLDGRSTLQLNGFWSIGGQRQFYELGNFGNLNLSINRQFLSRKLLLTLTVTDAFYTNQNTFVLRQGNITAEGSRQADTRRVGLNLRYNFGFKKREETNNPFNFDNLERNSR